MSAKFMGKPKQDPQSMPQLAAPIADERGAPRLQIMVLELRGSALSGRIGQPALVEAVLLALARRVVAVEAGLWRLEVLPCLI